MTLLPSTLAALVAAQSPGALGTVLVNVVFDRHLLGMGMLDVALRKGWTSRDASTDPVLMRVFDYDRAFTGSGQTILVHTSPDADFTLVTSKLSDETEIECVIAGPGFELVTRSVLGAGWNDWMTDTSTDVLLSDLLRAIGRR